MRLGQRKKGEDTVWIGPSLLFLFFLNSYFSLEVQVTNVSQKPIGISWSLMQALLGWRG
jgi:hypothetical protein